MEIKMGAYSIPCLSLRNTKSQLIYTFSWEAHFFSLKYLLLLLKNSTTNLQIENLYTKPLEQIDFRGLKVLEILQFKSNS